MFLRKCPSEGIESSENLKIINRSRTDSVWRKSGTVRITSNFVYFRILLGCASKFTVDIGNYTRYGALNGAMLT